VPVIQLLLNLKQPLRMGIVSKITPRLASLISKEPLTQEVRLCQSRSKEIITRIREPIMILPKLALFLNAVSQMATVVYRPMDLTLLAVRLDYFLLPSWCVYVASNNSFHQLQLEVLWLDQPWILDLGRQKESMVRTYLQ
jgi:hypothetical protein